MTQEEQKARWKAAVENPAVIKKHLDAVRAARCKKIRCVETGVVYDSQTDYAKIVGVTIGMVQAVLKNRKHTVKGYHLEYVK
ncbi:MAG TPA: hypothetical protein VLH56_09910 [Dissulfurispiraceae bacterium]|jgi:hypothetical protein|nr:hypothetical protein [Dissulfurispiraceae bacterium]